jgi:hypothetical protein
MLDTNHCDPCTSGGIGRTASKRTTEDLAMPLVWIRSDAAGAWPVMMDERDELACADGVDWHFVAAVESRGEGERLIEQLHFERPHLRRRHSPR